MTYAAGVFLILQILKSQIKTVTDAFLFQDILSVQVWSSKNTYESIFRQFCYLPYFFLDKTNDRIGSP